MIRLYNDGPRTVGIFRQSANYRKVKELKETINNSMCVEEECSYALNEGKREREREGGREGERRMDFVRSCKCTCSMYVHVRTICLEQQYNYMNVHAHIRV